MIRLNLSPEPRWLDLGHGVRVRVAPLTSAVMMAARAALRETVPDPDAPPAMGSAAVALVKTIGRLGILDWEGVGDQDGVPVPPSPERIDALLDVPVRFDTDHLPVVAVAYHIQQVSSIALVEIRA